MLGYTYNPKILNQEKAHSYFTYKCSLLDYRVAIAIGIMLC